MVCGKCEDDRKSSVITVITVNMSSILAQNTVFSVWFNKNKQDPSVLVYKRLR